MRVLVPVKRNSDLIEAKLSAITNPAKHHRMLVGLGVIGGGFGVGVTRQRDRNALLYLRRGLLALRWSDKVHRAKLIVFAPSPPVGKLLHHVINISLSQF